MNPTEAPVKIASAHNACYEGKRWAIKAGVQNEVDFVAKAMATDNLQYLYWSVYHIKAVNQTLPHWGWIRLAHEVVRQVEPRNIHDKEVVALTHCYVYNSPCLWLIPKRLELHYEGTRSAWTQVITALSYVQGSRRSWTRWIDEDIADYCVESIIMAMREMHPRFGSLRERKGRKRFLKQLAQRYIELYRMYN